ncbi:hypothetical protein RJ640_006880 [Escallonia rubra]|uniref:Uncharacterized protein n=1 Tax=Escallonia rubra TaxID=112253 RepID=A0AA88RE08_9ASTE|nr:hypothetical protein RJ640_006880 [Escallonia rubra]
MFVTQTRVLFGFGHQTAYLSVTYFDRFVAVRAIDSEKYWAARLLAVACLSLAAKMEECRVPALSDFPVEEFNFESNVMQRMELLVLNTLEWKMGSITPLAYIHYFLSKFCKQLPRKNIVSIVVELIFATVRDTNLMGYRPSAIASAAVLVALDRRLTRQDLELKINALSLSGFLDIENLFICYNRMQELLDTENIKLPKRIPSPDLSRIRLRGTHLCENSSITSFVVNKRKRLIFSDYDKNCDTPEEKRRR